AEGCMTAQDCQKELSQYINVDNRVAVLGHVHREGSPTGEDRVLASRLGAYALDLLMQCETAKCVGIKNNKIVATSFDEIFDGKDLKFDYSLYELANKLSI
ncbi:6-phosphofructokinase, partial [Staphylococcus aureus]|uniref:6-phosphofructokinase n=1 Tax=Staphylococcus aureus TaxID=1280 RepID=UPI000AE1A96A